MAEYRSMRKCVILLALIACHMILSLEGRQLKYREKEIKTQRETGTEGSISFGDSASIHKDDFRPTTPGNSPGVGHKHTKDEEDVHIPSAENTVVRKEEILPSISSGDSTAVYNDDFRPTTPGNSPGVGHKHAEDVHIPSTEDTMARKIELLSPIIFRDSAAVNKFDFRPTTPSNSPGVGHEHAKDVEDVHISTDENTVAGKKKISPPISFGDSATVYEDDFQPTTPGHTAGVAPSVSNKTALHKEDFRPTTPGHSPGVTPFLSNKTAVYKDDFRPTTPGNSPGVGHKHAKDEEDGESKVLRHKHSREVFKNEFHPPTPPQNPSVAPALSDKTAERKA